MLKTFVKINDFCLRLKQRSLIKFYKEFVIPALEIQFVLLMFQFRKYPSCMLGVRYLIGEDIDPDLERSLVSLSLLSMLENSIKETPEKAKFLGYSWSV